MSRIFLSDRHEKIEKSLQSLDLIENPNQSKEGDEENNIESGLEFIVNTVDIEILQLRLDDPELLKDLSESIQKST